MKCLSLTSRTTRLGNSQLRSNLQADQAHLLHRIYLQAQAALVHSALRCMHSRSRMIIQRNSEVFPSLLWFLNILAIYNKLVALALLQILILFFDDYFALPYLESIELIYVSVSLLNKTLCHSLAEAAVITV